MRNIRKNILVLLFGIIFVTFTSFNTNAEWYDEPNSSDNSDGFKVGELVLVGATGTNQLADAIGSQMGAPVQAYVVSGDVTTSQSLERNIVESATL